MQTINSGGVEGDLALFDSLGTNSVVYVTNFTPPNPVINLSAGTIYNTAVQLNFTPPTSVNGVDFYEVYLNGEKSHLITTASLVDEIEKMVREKVAIAEAKQAKIIVRG